MNYIEKKKGSSEICIKTNLTINIYMYDTDQVEIISKQLEGQPLSSSVAPLGHGC